MTQKHYESLAKKILGGIEDVITLKLRELKDDLLKLREGFQEKKAHQKIAGCKSWDEFCKTKLHRTKRAVNLLLAGKPQVKKEQKSREETSHRKPVDQQVGSIEAAPIKEDWPALPEEEGEPDPDSVREAMACNPDAAPKSRHKSGPGISFEEDLERVRDKARHIFHKTDNPEEIARTFAKLLQLLYPHRRFKIAIEEIELPPRPRMFNMVAHPTAITGCVPQSKSSAEKAGLLDKWEEDKRQVLQEAGLAPEATEVANA